MKIVKKTFTSKNLGNYTIELQKITEKEFKGDIIVTDPCYYVNYEIWQNIVGMRYMGYKPTDFCNYGLAIITVNGKICEFIYVKTAYGDDYPIDKFNSGKLIGRASVGVDTGIISVALLDDAKHLRIGKKPYISIKELNRNYYPKIIGFNGIVQIKDCNFTGDINVITDYKNNYE